MHLPADDGPPLAGHGGHLGDGERAVAVRLSQVLSYLWESKNGPGLNFSAVG